MFLVAALWNWILAIVFLILPRIDESYFTTVGLVIPNTLLWLDSFSGLIIAFGIGFYLVSKDMSKNHGLIQMAVFEKFLVFIVGAGWFFFGQASMLVVLVVFVDLIFGFLFIESLLAIRKKTLT
jgi:hypothetical protein